MKTGIETDRMGYRWVEYCDRCGDLIQDKQWLSFSKPNPGEADFCSRCMHFLKINDIDYATATKLYFKKAEDKIVR